MHYECPFCHKPLIFSGIRTDKDGRDLFGDLGASFYTCGCVKHYSWGDALPSNRWSHHLNGDWWYWNEGSTLGYWENIKMTRNKIPIRRVFVFR